MNARLRRYVQDRLAGELCTPDGTPVPGPVTQWNGRRHGRRQDRRWVQFVDPARFISGESTRRVDSHSEWREARPSWLEKLRSHGTG